MPSLRAIRRACAAELGRLGIITTTAAATGEDADRRIISTQLLGVDLGPTRLAQGWCYLCSGPLAGEQRRQTDAALDGEAGELTMVAPFSAVVGAGVVVELLAPIPADRDLDRDGWRQYINRSAEKVSIHDRISIPATGAYRYEITAYPWLTDVGRIHGVLHHAGADWGNAVPLGAGTQIVYDVEKTYLEVDGGYATGELVLAVRRPADTRIKRAGVWTDTLGASAPLLEDALLEDDDECIPPLGVMKALAMREALAARHQWAPHGEREAWQVADRLWSQKAALAARMYAGVGSVQMQTRVYGRRDTMYPKGWSG